MSFKVRQKDIRSLLRSGSALPLSSAQQLIIEGARKYHDFRKLSYSAGTYGINGLCIEDTITGDLYADAARTSLVFYFA